MLSTAIQKVILLIYIIDDSESCLNGGTWHTEYHICLCNEKYTGAHCEQLASTATTSTIQGKSFN